MASARGGGGAATQSGIIYQNRVAAWMAVGILAEQEASPPWDLPANVSLKFLRCETEQPVDDLLIGTSEGGHVFIQAKHQLELGRNSQSEFGKTIDQFIRQFLAYPTHTSSNRPWERPLDAKRDRLVLVTSSGSSAPIREELPNLLTKIRELSSHQEIREAASNSQKAEKVFDSVLSLITMIWQNIKGNEPTDDEKRQLLTLIRVQILDVDADGGEELSAKDRLRASVITQTNQADTAWSSLITFCGELAKRQSGADRAILQQHLIEEQIVLETIRSYRQDIERLQQYSYKTAQSLADFSEIKVGDETVKIARPVTQMLRLVAENESLLVIGDPGAGKSGTIYDFVKILNEEQHDVVFLAVDKLEAINSKGLREELELDRSLDEVLLQWQNSKPGWLIIDALDAARSAISVKTFRDLISTIIKSGGRWRVVVSIRKFDLRYSVNLQELFRGRSAISHDFLDSEFRNIKHINISKLSDEELAQIEPQSQILADFVTKTEDKLRELLTIPFNLRLMGDLIGIEVNPDNLIPIKTQIELLDLYWNKRIIHVDDDLGDAREALLRKVVEKMVETRSLRVNRSDVIDVNHSQSDSQLLKGVLSSHILTEWKSSNSVSVDRTILTFAHHVLFDYAVSCLILRGLTNITVKRLESEFDLALAIRPSIVFYFQHLWFLDSTRQNFWQVVLQILQSQAIPEIGKIIGLGVAAELIQNLSDCNPLFEILEATPQPLDSHVIYRALYHLTGSILVDTTRLNVLLTSSPSSPLCEIIERFSQSINLSLFSNIRMLVWNVCKQSEGLSQNQLDLAGLTARRFFEFAWKENLSKQDFINTELESLCYTFKSNPIESAKLIRQLLETDALQAYGYISIFRLANQIELLMSDDIELVKNIYIVAFQHEEISSDSTSISGSRIMSLISNRQQDFKMGLYGLAESYPEFLRIEAIQATYALVKIVESYAIKSHRISQVIESSFDFNGRKVINRTDYSSIWDCSTYRNDYELQILDHFMEYFQELSSDSDRIGELQAIVNIIVTENRLAVLWRCLLKCGTTFPQTLGLEIRYLAWAIPILTGIDTMTLAGNFIQSVFSYLTHTEREKVELAILSISGESEDEFKESNERTRNRLLGCLPSEMITTLESRKILDELATNGGVPPNEELFKMGGVTSITWGEKEYLSDLGVPVDEEANQRIQNLGKPIEEFFERYRNSIPQEKDILDIFLSLQALYKSLKTADVDGVHLKQSDYAWAQLAEACTCIVKIETLNCTTGIGALSKQVLLEASEHPEPVHNRENDHKFNNPSWGKPAARIDAAQGLIQIARHSTCVDKILLDTIDRLSYDPVPAVRYQVAVFILSLYQTAPELMWKIIDRMGHKEISHGVLQGLLHSLDRLLGAHQEKVSELTKNIFDRVSDSDGADRVKEFCISIFIRLYLWQDNSIAVENISNIANHPEKFYLEAKLVVRDMRECFILGSIKLPDPLEERVRQRSFELTNNILNSTLRTFNILRTKYQYISADSWEHNDREIFEHLIQVADTIIQQLFFASGAFDSQMGEKKSAASLGQRGKERFLNEAESILDNLATVGFPHIAHKLIETLVFLVDIDPRKIFLKVRQVILAGKSSNYQYEYMGADLIVPFIERFLAEYRYVLLEDEECLKGLVKILDIFVEAGWHSARQLTYRMEDIFR
jgi:signal recognition particle GTPase